MKHTINLILFLWMLTPVFSQTEKPSLFIKNPPQQSPAIFIASMPPCLIGVAMQYGSDIGIGKNTLKQCAVLIAEAHKKVPAIKKEIKALEIQIMIASKEERYADYKTLLTQLSQLKIDASLFHEALVKKARQVFDPKDLQKIDAFIVKNQDEFLKAVKL